jgi:hypothetical protein
MVKLCTYYEEIFFTWRNSYYKTEVGFFVFTQIIVGTVGYISVAI